MSNELWDAATKKLELKDRPVDRKILVDQVAKALSDFMATEGQSAQKLLRATRKCILFDSYEEGSYSAGYLLDGNGLTKVYAYDGMWARESALGTMEPRAMAEAIASPSGQNSPEGIIPFIRSQLDAIAKEVMRHQ